MKPAALVFVLFVGTASAQHVEVAPEVTSVATVGRWQNGGNSGSYRVVVVRDGWEHLWSRVYVEWLPDPTEREAPTPTPVSVQELIPPGIPQGAAVLDASARGLSLGILEVTVRATSNMQVGAKRQTFVFRANQPGIVKLTRPVVPR